MLRTRIGATETIMMDQYDLKSQTSLQLPKREHMNGISAGVDGRMVM